MGEKTREHFTCSPRTASDLNFLIVASYAGFLRKHKITYEQFEEDVRNLPFGKTKAADRALYYCREQVISHTTEGARHFAAKSMNVSNSLEEKVRGYRA